MFDSAPTRLHAGASVPRLTVGAMVFAALMLQPLCMLMSCRRARSHHRLQAYPSQPRIVLFTGCYTLRTDTTHMYIHVRNTQLRDSVDIVRTMQCMDQPLQYVH